MDPIPERECGECTACCTLFPIASEAIVKQAGETCTHCDGRGCAIYILRPQACRDFYCGWRMLAFVPENLRPDLSGVVVVENQGLQGDADGVSFVITDIAALDQPGMLECVAGLVHANVASFLAVPGPAGHHMVKVQINTSLARAVAERNAAAMKQIMTAAIEALAKGPFEPVRLPERAPQPAG